MNSFEKNITFIIVSFRSSHIIEEAIKSINSNIKIIVVENSNNIEIKNYLEKKFSNVEVIIAQENLGYSKGNNLGISKVSTQYAFILNPDTVLEENCLSEFYKAHLMLHDNFTILAPNLLNNYGFFTDKNNFFKDGIMQVDYVKGFAMLINLKKTNLEKIFDENFFLFLEEIDLCKRVKNQGGKVFVIQNSKVKHFGFLTAYKTTLFKFFLSIIKLLIALILLNQKKILIYYYRINGLFNAFLKRPAWLRPDDI